MTVTKCTYVNPDEPEWAQLVRSLVLCWCYKAAPPPRFPQCRSDLCRVVKCFYKSAAPSRLFRHRDGFLSLDALKEASAVAIIHFLLTLSTTTEKITCSRVLTKQISYFCQRSAPYFHLTDYFFKHFLFQWPTFPKNWHLSFCFFDFKSWIIQLEPVDLLNIY